MLRRLRGGRLVDDRPAAARLQPGHDVLVGGGPRPQKLPGLGVERPDQTCLARNAGDDLAPLAGAHIRVDPRHFRRIRGDLGLDNHPLEDVVEVPVVARQVLVVPHHFACVRVDRQRGVGVQQVGLPRAPQLLGQRRGRTGAPVNEVELRIVAAGHPGGRVAAARQRQSAPGVAARLVGRGDRRDAPQLLSGSGVVTGDEATARPRGRGVAARPGDQLALDDYRTCRLGHLLREVGPLRLPDQCAGARVEGDEEGVVRREENLVVVDGDVAVAGPRTGQVSRGCPAGCGGTPTAGRPWWRRAPARYPRRWRET